MSSLAASDQRAVPANTTVIQPAWVRIAHWINAGRAVPKDPDLATESLELSNSSALEGMTSLVTTTRDFEMMSRVVQAFSDIEHKAATEIMGQR